MPPPSMASLSLSLSLFLLFFTLLPLTLSQKTMQYTFNIQRRTVTRLCHSKSIITVNGQFPGPTINVTEGDTVVVKVVNNVNENITIHWHGLRQLRSGWYDGPAYITQCPIQKGQSYVYNFSTTGQRGTFFWHAHISWLRATLYGPIIILPQPNNPYPFPTPFLEVPIILGEWWKADTEKVIAQALKSGAGPSVSNAYTINGFPGPFYNNCSKKDTFTLEVAAGKTYLLRIINAALNDELFFAVANHSLTVVEADGLYTKPFTTQTLLITPGQTTNVLLNANQNPPPNAAFLISASPYTTTAPGTFDNSTTSAILTYNSSKTPTSFLSPQLPNLKDTNFAAKFSGKLKSLANKPPNLPLKVDESLLFTVGLGFDPCPKGQKCQGPNGTKFTASMNNISFVLPTVALLQSSFGGSVLGVNKNNNVSFPDKPLNVFDYTGRPPNNTSPIKGTGVKVVGFNTTVQVVLQDTSIGGNESHPLHLHGHNFFVVGMGFGNFDGSNDPNGFNLVDPPERNTVGVPAGGWVAIRFRADNPGVWFMHCHLEVHTSWGLKMAWVVKNGKGPSQTLPPPPPDLPLC